MKGFRQKKKSTMQNDRMFYTFRNRQFLKQKGNSLYIPIRSERQLKKGARDLNRLENDSYRVEIIKNFKGS